MNRPSREALAVIRACVASGRYRVLLHFVSRMDERGLFWPDVQSVISAPSAVEDGGEDDFGRPKWILTGRTTDNMDLTVVCVLDRDKRGHMTLFVTAYWK